jgi:hypothetical protein
LLNGLLLARGRWHDARLRIRLIVDERQHTDNERSGQSRHAIKSAKAGGILSNSLRRVTAKQKGKIVPRLGKTLRGHLVVAPRAMRC